MYLKLLLIGIILVLVIILMFHFFRSQNTIIQHPPQPVRRIRRTYTFNPQIDFIPLYRAHSPHVLSRDESSLTHESIELENSSTEELDEFPNVVDFMRIVVLGDENESTEKTERRDKDKTREDFFQELNEHDNDKQNVHNSQIRKILTNRLLRIIELNGGIHESYQVGELHIPHEQYIKAKMQQVKSEIMNRASQYFDGLVLQEQLSRENADMKVSKVNMMLNKIEKGYNIIMRNGQSYNEDFILVQVWDRINHSDNFANREQLQVSLIDNLIDGVEERNMANEILAAAEVLLMGLPEPSGIENTHMTVCINGRVARVLTSLVLLDADKTISQPEMDEKELANEAYMKAHKLIENETSDHINELLLKTDLTSDEENEIEKFEEHLRQIIDKELRHDYQDLLDKSQLDKIIENAQAGI